MIIFRNDGTTRIKKTHIFKIKTENFTDYWRKVKEITTSLFWDFFLEIINVQRKAKGLNNKYNFSKFGYNKKKSDIMLNTRIISYTGNLKG